MKMKKALSIILTSAILLTTACSDNNTSSVNSQNNSTSSTESSKIDSDTSSKTNSDVITEAPAENTPNNLNDTLPQFSPANIHYENVKKGKEGYYYKARIKSDGGRDFEGLSYYDNATGKTIPLCSKPQCMHDGNDFCTATGLQGDNRSVLYNGYIYRLGIRRTDTEFTIGLLRTDLQGNELSRISDIHTGLCGEIRNTSTIGDSVVFHYGKMFISFNPIADKEEERILYMVDLETGAGKEIHVPPPENNATRLLHYSFRSLMADGDFLYYTTKEARWNHPQVHDDAHLTYDRTTMYRFNIRTGETEMISAMPDVYSSFTVNNGIIYYTVADRSDNTFSLYSYDIEKDETKTIIDKHQQNYVNGKYVSDRSKVTVLTDRKYLYVCTSGIDSGTTITDRVDDVDFYIYSLDGKELVHGLPGMEELIDMEKDWYASFSALDGEVYFNYQDRNYERKNTDEDKNSGMYVINTEDLINGNSSWKKLYRRYV